MVEKKIDAYLKELEALLQRLPKEKRASTLEEMRDHLESMVRQQRNEGKEDEEILTLIETETIPPKTFADELLRTEKSGRDTKTKQIQNWIYILLIACVLVSFSLPEYKGIPFVIFMLVVAYLVGVKKYLWVFAAFRKNPREVKNKDRIATVGAIYILAIAAVILIGQLTDFAHESMVLLVTLAVLTIAFYIFTAAKRSKGA